MKSLVQALLSRLSPATDTNDTAPALEILASAPMYQAISQQTFTDKRQGLSCLRFEGGGTLEPGIYHLSWSEFASFFGGMSPKRAELVAGLEKVKAILEQTGSKRLFVGGSIVTAKLEPSDFDACYDCQDVDLDRLASLEPALLFEQATDAQNLSQVYGGTVEPIRVLPSLGASMFEILQFDTRTKKLKGIVCIELGS